MDRARDGGIIANRRKTVRRSESGWIVDQVANLTFASEREAVTYAEQLLATVTGGEVVVIGEDGTSRALPVRRDRDDLDQPG